MNPLIALGVFCLAFAQDVFWAKYTMATSGRRRSAATAWAFVIAVLGVFGFAAFLRSRLYVCPLAAGAALGTWVTVRPPR